MALRFQLRLNPDSVPLDLDPFMVKGGYSRTVEIAAEDQLNNFRGSQIQITLDDKLGTFSTGEFALSGGEEISIIRYTSVRAPVWSGTIDPAYIEKDPDSTNLVIRVLQQGSLLNTVFAGLPDWTLDSNGELVFDTSRNYRWKGTSDQWVKRYNEDGTFGHNEILTENTDVFYTPSAKDALEDELYRSKFAERVYHFHTAGNLPGDVEYPFPQIYEGGYENAPGERFIGHFEPHYRPNFDMAPADWDTFGGVVQDRGSYLRTKDPQLPLKRHEITALLTELVGQFNQSARFPLTFDPAVDCVIIPPRIDSAIEIIKRQADVSFIDIRPYNFVGQNYLLLVVNWFIPTNPFSGQTSTAIYRIDNETELVPLLERAPSTTSQCWPTFQRGMRFARTNHANDNVANAIVYAMSGGPRETPGTHNTYHLRFDASWKIVNLLNGNVTSFSDFIVEELGEFTDFPLPPAYVINRSALLSASGFSVRDSNNLPRTAEQEPVFNRTISGRIYRAQNGGLTVSGALFDRVAVDAENQKIAAIFSDLAKLTHSRWFVTAEGRLKFLSRQYYGTEHNLKPTRSLKQLKTFVRKYTEEDLPTIGSGLVLPDNFRQAHKNWVEDNVLGNESQGYEVPFPLEDFETFPQVSDCLNFPDPAIPPIPDSARRQKYGPRYQLEQAVLDIDNETLQLTAAIPTL